MPRATTTLENVKLSQIDLDSLSVGVSVRTCNCGLVIVHAWRDSCSACFAVKCARAFVVAFALRENKGEKNTSKGQRLV